MATEPFFASITGVPHLDIFIQVGNSGGERPVWANSPLGDVNFCFRQKKNPL